MAPDGIGAPLRRKEDYRFLTGAGHYTDDINRPGQAYAYFLRSPHAHARIRSIDTSGALASPGVVAVFTGDDLAKDKIGGLVCGWAVTQKDGTIHKSGNHPALAQGKVRYVGDHVAVVIADTLAQAKDGAEKIAVDYELLPASVDTATTHKTPRALVHDEIPNNLCLDWEIGDRAAADAAIAKAHHVTTVEIVNNRLIPNAIEPRAAVGEYDRGGDNFTLYTTSQNPHVARLVLSAFNGIAPEHKLRVVAPDVGGGFGSKIFIYAEETVCVWAAKKVRRPVKWTADRSEAFLADAHGRDHVTKAELAMDADGKFLGLRVNTVANLGAYLSTFASCVPTYLYALLLSGQYKIPAIYCDVQGVYTNTAPVDAYRGAGRPEATYVVERIVETAAREMKIDPAEIRRRNFIQPTEYPYQTPVILTYDCGDYPQGLELALKAVDYAGYPARKAETERRGKLRGIGFCCYIEACGIAPSAAVGSLGAGVGLWESAKIRFNPTGNVTIHTGSHSHGQGHETTFPQLLATHLGVPVDTVEVVHGDTDKTPFGMGTYGSRSLAVGGSAIIKAADKIIAKGMKIAAHLLEAAEGDIEFKEGKFTVKGTDRSKSIQEIVFAAYVPHNFPPGLEPGMEESAFYDPVNFTFPAGTQVCEVEIDPETGVTHIDRFVAVDDFGVLINPMIVEGQVHGGIVQGIGQALFENGIYDKETGQLLTGSYMDYQMPRAGDLPDLEVSTYCTKNPSNPLGVKGCGEAGAIAAPATVMNAVTDAIGQDLQMPATPEKVWRAVQAMRRAAE